MGSRVNVKDIGAAGNNTQNDTTAIQAAIDLAETFTDGGEVYFPAGRYKVTSTLTMQNNIHLVGDGRRASQLRYVPSTGSPIVDVNPGATPSLGETGSIRDMMLVGTSTHSGKIGIRMTNVANFDVVRCWIDFNDADSGLDDVGIQMLGREQILIDSCRIRAPVPIRVSANPSPPTGGGSDHLNVFNCYLQAGDAPATLAHACVLVDADAFLTTMNFTGSSPWVGGAHGFYWAATSGAFGDSYQLHFSNIRHEQAASAGWAFYISPADVGGTSIGSVTMMQCRSGSANNGLYMRRVNEGAIIGCLFNSGANAGIDIDNSEHIEMIATWNNGTRSLNDMRQHSFIGGHQSLSATKYVRHQVLKTGTSPATSASAPWSMMDGVRYHGKTVRSIASGGTIEQTPLRAGTYGTSLHGFCLVSVSDNATVQEFGIFALSSAKAAELMTGTSNMAAGNTGGKFCLYDQTAGTNNADQISFINNLAVTVDMVAMFFFDVPDFELN